MTTMTDCHPDIEERYLVAGNTSDLSVCHERRGAADLLIAAGWSPSRLGAAALRLHSEWSAAALPRRPDREQIARIALDLPLLNGKPDLAHANRVALSWHQVELRRVFDRLRSLPALRDQLAVQALQRGMSSPAALAAEVLCHWLDPVCPTCHGLKFMPVKNAPALSAKVCPACRGLGRTDPPQGQDGRWLLNYLDRCVAVARGSIKKRLHAIQKMV